MYIDSRPMDVRRIESLVRRPVPLPIGIHPHPIRVTLTTRGNKADLPFRMGEEDKEL